MSKNRMFLMVLFIFAVALVFSGCTSTTSTDTTTTTSTSSTTTTTTTTSTTTTSSGATTTTTTTTSTTTTSTTTTSTTTTTSALFYSNTANTTPVFEVAGAQGASLRAQVASWESGSSLYSVYYTLREFVASRDEGVVDRSNLYKLLVDVDTVYSGLSYTLESITEQSITPPFGQLSSVTCDQAFNDTAGKQAGARKDTTEEVDAIITWIWTEEAQPLKAEYGIATLAYDKLTNDITVEMTYSVDYDTSDTTTDYNLRCFVEGNTNDNSFQFKYIIGTTAIVAKGVSQGTGNYMLFKYAGSGEATNYIVVPSDAGESYFSDQNDNPTNIYSSAESLPASVEVYKTWVVNTDFFTTSDLVLDISALNNGNDKAGTIYLDYN